MKNLPKLLLIGLLALFVSACASTKNTQAASEPQQKEPQQKQKKAEDSDPLEGFNRVMFGFNDGIDTVLIKPISQGYQFITPDPVERGFSNFFSNLLEIRNALNSFLQGKGGQGMDHTGRFLINSTVGLAGFLDPASEMGIAKTDGEDFGQTLGAWGVESGPYIVLPFLGPSTLRDGAGLPVDMYTDPVGHIDHVPTRNQTTFLKLVDTRASLLESEKLLSGDKYVFIRDAYLQRRKYLVEDGEVEDKFGDDLKGDF